MSEARRLGGADLLYAGNSRRHRLAGWLLALAPVVLLGAIHIPLPFSGDSAMFVWGARELADGARLYVDFWDMKQPGIFWFCQFAGSLFSFTEIGIHFAELLWMAALAVVLVPVARRHLERPWLAFLAPLLCLGPYYAVVTHHYLTMVEVLVHLPLAVFLLLVIEPTTPPRPAGSGRRMRHIGAGLMVAAVAVFKLMLAIVPAAMLAALIAFEVLSGRSNVRAALVERIVPSLAGFALGAGLAAGWLALTGSLGPALWASFTYPQLAISEFPHKPSAQLLKSFGWLWDRIWLFALLAPAIFLLPGRERRLPLAVAIAAWIAAGALAISLQFLSYWIYQTILLIVPFGLLALLGIDGLVAAIRCRLSAATSLAASAIAVAVLLYIGVLKPLVWGVAYPLYKSEPWTAATLLEYQSRREPRMRQLHRSTQFLSAPDALPGRVALLGDPRVIFLSDRRPVTEINGWTYYLSAQIAAAAAALERERPPYVYVSWYVAHILRNRNDALFAVLRDHYERMADDDADGTWFRRR